MNQTNDTQTGKNKDTFRSLAEILLGFWERHQKEWEANGFDHAAQINKLKETQNKKQEGGEL